MNSVKATNAYEGVLLLGQDESMLVSVAGAEQLRDDLHACVVTASGKVDTPVLAVDLEDKQKIVLNDNVYTVKNTLTEREDKVVVQAEDYFGATIELTVDEDFEFTVREAIE